MTCGVAFVFCSYRRPLSNMIPFLKRSVWSRQTSAVIPSPKSRRDGPCPFCDVYLSWLKGKHISDGWQIHQCCYSDDDIGSSWNRWCFINVACCFGFIVVCRKCIYGGNIRNWRVTVCHKSPSLNGGVLNAPTSDYVGDQRHLNDGKVRRGND